MAIGTAVQLGGIAATAVAVVLGGATSWFRPVTELEEKVAGLPGQPPVAWYRRWFARGDEQRRRRARQRDAVLGLALLLQVCALFVSR